MCHLTAIPVGSEHAVIASESFGQSNFDGQIGRIAFKVLVQQQPFGLEVVKFHSPSCDVDDFERSEASLFGGVAIRYVADRKLEPALVTDGHRRHGFDNLRNE